MSKTEYINRKKEYYCFYDSEFNAYDDRTNISIPQEVVSIGICIVDKKNNLVEDYYSLIRLKGAKHISKRCEEFTGITTKDVRYAPDFLTVVKEATNLVKKYDIKNIYCYGLEDKRALMKTSKLYGGVSKVKELSKRCRDVREEFRKKTKGKLADQGLLFLKKVCGLGDEVKHNALSDAVDLADIYDVIMRKGYSEELYNRLSKEREEAMYYKSARNVKEEHSVVVPSEVIKAKDIIVDFLQKYKIPHMNDGTKKAIIDDLETLLVKK